MVQDHLEYTAINLTGGRFSSFIDLQIDEASEGDVIGPFVHQDKVNLVKIYETTEEEQAKVGHILITSKKEMKMMQRIKD